MKDAIDHVLMFILPNIYGERMAFLVGRELKIGFAEAKERLIERGRYYAPDDVELPKEPTHLRNFMGRMT